MNRVLVTFAGGRLGIGVSRALKSGPEYVRVMGVDSDRVKVHRAAVDEVRLVPRAKEDDYLPVLAELVRETGTEFVWPNHEGEIAVIASEPGAVPAATFLPPPDTIAVCQDKLASYERFRRSGVPVPASTLVSSPADLEKAFRDFGTNIWVRAISGTGGKGSLPVSDLETARGWLDLNEGWGQFMAAEKMTESTVTWESVWWHGDLVFAQGRRRLYWEFSGIALSGVTGIGGAHQWVADPEVDGIALGAIEAVDPKPHGIFSVDMAYDSRGHPRVTEINCGRFMSGGVIHPFRGHINVAQLILGLVSGKKPEASKPLLNTFSTRVVLVHGMDVEPVEIALDEVERCARELEERRAGLSAAALVGSR